MGGRGWRFKGEGSTSRGHCCLQAYQEVFVIQHLTPPATARMEEYHRKDHDRQDFYHTLPFLILHKGLHSENVSA